MRRFGCAVPGIHLSTQNVTHANAEAVRSGVAQKIDLEGR